jgi:hypothetical protein
MIDLTNVENRDESRNISSKIQIATTIVRKDTSISDQNLNYFSIFGLVAWCGSCGWGMLGD